MSDDRPRYFSTQHSLQMNAVASSIQPSGCCSRQESIQTTNGRRNGPRQSVHLWRRIHTAQWSPPSQTIIRFPFFEKGRRHLRRRSWPSERHLIIEVASHRRVYHRRIRLRRLATTIERGRLDPPNAVVTVLEAADAKLDDGVVIRLRSLHTTTRRDKAVNRAAPGDARRLKDEQLAGLDVLQRKQDLKLPRVGGLTAEPRLPF